MDDIIVDKRSRKIFASFLNMRSESTDVRMRTAISWDPCGSGDEIESRNNCVLLNISVVINILVLIILKRA